MLASMYLDLGLRRVRLGLIAKPHVAAINTVAIAVDDRSSRLREPGPGGLFANFHIVGKVPQR
jgi:hypothetical protein